MNNEDQVNAHMCRLFKINIVLDRLWYKGNRGDTLSLWCAPDACM